MDSIKAQHKLGNTETSIFAIMSQMSEKHNAINLSQGFPNFPISTELKNRVDYYISNNYNQYAPMPGVLRLRENISKMFEYNHGAKYNPDKEITITAGATQALYTAISAFIRQNDEVIIFEPAYDSYAPVVAINGGIVKYSTLSLPNYRINWDQVEKLINNKTRMIIINTPHNPTGSILSADDMKKLESITRNTDIIIISDEVYEHLVFDNNTHHSAARFKELASRTFIIGSFGKTFHATGWKTGFALAPEKLMDEFRKLHQFVVFAVNTPVQNAIADFLNKRENYLSLGSFYQDKRDYFLNKIKNSRFKPIKSEGTYFQVLDYSNISNEKEINFATHLVKEYGIASVPISPFYHKKNDNKLLRFCFAKTEETINKAAEILCKI
ncbi:MAG: methionine aminotransferase [Bacteroidota bacterium]|nr:methionine aminotransferase [Bacteroidota bacterium]